MKILRTYILKDFISTFIFSILMLTGIILTGNLIKVVDMVVRKGVFIIDAIRLLAIFVPFTLRFTIPLSFLLGILLTIGRLISDNEIIAIKMAGISIFKILNIFLILGIIFSLLLFILNDKFIPGFQYKYRKIIKGIYSKNLSALIEPGVFLDDFKNYILYVSDKDQYNLKNIFIYETGEEAISKVTFAKKGRFIVEKNILKMELEDGFRDEVKSDNKKELYRMNFRKFFMEIPIEEKKANSIRQKPCDMSLEEIKLRIGYFRKKGLEPLDLIFEYYQRINYSFSVITFILLGFGASLKIRHREKTINFGIAFLLAGLYYLISILSQTLVHYHLISPLIGSSLANMVFGFIGVYFIWKNAYN
ncbi:MAG: LptF/LptG family permease [Candidatus Omnitrophica bacterium]|nr:LptF/LptG family permease [Candidatus Omnitrophota bacterium]